MTRRVRNLVCIWIMVLGLVNFVAYTVVYLYLGGDAMNGKIEVTREEPRGASDAEDWNGIQSIRIEDNTFVHWDATARTPVASRSNQLDEHPVHAIYLQDIADARICGNVFLPRDNLPPESYAITLDDFENVRLENNSFRNWPSSKHPVSQTTEPASQ